MKSPTTPLTVDELVSLIGPAAGRTLEQSLGTLVHANNPFDACIASGYAKGVWFGLTDSGKVDVYYNRAACLSIDEMLVKKMEEFMGVEKTEKHPHYVPTDAQKN